MIAKLKAWIARIRKYWYYFDCYEKMEKTGDAYFGDCCGISEINPSTNYMAEKCVSCRYWVCRGKDDFKP